MDNPKPLIRIRILSKRAYSDAYPAEASCDDGSFYANAELHFDQQALLESSHDLERYGRALSDMLFAGPIADAYDEITRRAQRDHDGHVRVQLWIDAEAPELHSLAWETLYHRHRGRTIPLTTSSLTPFSRYTRLRQPESKPVSERPIQLVFAIANPRNLDEFGEPAINITQQIASLHAATGALPHPNLLQVSLLPGQTGLSPGSFRESQAAGYSIHEGPTTLTAIMRHLRNAHVLHLVCHSRYPRSGEGEPALFLEKESGEVALVRTGAFMDRFAGLARLPQLVFLASCETAGGRHVSHSPQLSIAASMVQAGVPAVLAMRGLITFATLYMLTQDFYAHLLEHGVVDLALNEARNLFSDQFDWAVPVLYTCLSDGLLFDPTRSVPSSDSLHNTDKAVSSQPVDAPATSSRTTIHSLRAEQVFTGDNIQIMVDRRRTGAGAPHSGVTDAPVAIVPRRGGGLNTMTFDEMERTLRVQLGYDLQVVRPCSLLNVDFSFEVPGKMELTRLRQCSIDHQPLHFGPNLRLQSPFTLQPQSAEVFHAKIWRVGGGHTTPTSLHVTIHLEIAEAGRMEPWQISEYYLLTRDGVLWPNTEVQDGEIAPDFVRIDLRIRERSPGDYEVTAEGHQTGEAGPEPLNWSKLTSPDLGGKIRRLEGRSRAEDNEAYRDVGTAFLDDSGSDESLFRDVGTELFPALLSGRVLGLYERLYEHEVRNRANTHLRISLDIDERAPEVAAIPWEFMWREDFLATQPKSLLTRHLRSSEHGGIETLTLRGNPRVLVVIPEGSGLDLEREKQAIISALQTQGLQYKVLDGKVPISQVADALSETPTYHILHYIGHGDWLKTADRVSGRLRFNAPDAASHDEDWVDESRLRSNVGAYGDNLKLVVLNSCWAGSVQDQVTRQPGRGFLGVAPSLIHVGIPAVVAMQYEIRNDVATVFAETFYKRLTSGRWRGYVDIATTLARQACYDRFPDNKGFGSIVLYLRSQNGLLFK